MRKMLTIGAVLIVGSLGSFGFYRLWIRTSNHYLGLWVVDTDDESNRKNGNHYWPNPFFFDGKGVTILVVETRPGPHGDNYRRLEARLVNNELSYQSPFSGEKGIRPWMRLAEIKNNEVFCESNGKIWRMKRRKQEELSKDYEPYFVERPFSGDAGN